MRSKNLVPICLLLGTTLSAQVAPPSAATVEGTANNAFLFGRSNQVRIMDVYDKAALPFTTPRLIGGIDLRMDTVNNKTPYPAKANVFLIVEMSTSHATSEITGKVFDSFHGKDRTQVFGARLNVPVQSVPTTPGLRPFNITIPFTQNWFYTLSPMRGGRKAPTSLVVDYKVFDKPTSTAYVLDMCGFCEHNATEFGPGAQCLGSTGNRLMIAAQPGVYGGGYLTYTVSGAQPKSSITMALSAGTLPTFTPISIATGSGCFLNFTPLVKQGATADKAGRAVFRYNIPRTNKYLDLAVHAQVAAYDINANTGLHVTSRGLSTKICGPNPVCQLMQLNGNASVAKTAQSNVYGLAHVIRFR